MTAKVYCDKCGIEIKKEKIELKINDGFNSEVFEKVINGNEFAIINEFSNLIKKQFDLCKKCEKEFNQIVKENNQKLIDFVNKK